MRGAHREVREVRGPQSFRANALIMVAGTALSQGLVFLTLLVFARLFDREVIGVQAVFVSVSGLLVTVASLRLDLALVLERDDRDAHRVARTAVLQGVALALVVLVLVSVAGGPVGRLLSGGATSTTWLWLVPAAVVTASIYQVGVSVANREGRFLVIVGADCGASVAFAACGLLLWWVSRHDGDLVVARFGSQAVACVVLLLLGRTLFALRDGRGHTWSVVDVWRRHRQFLLFNTPYSVVGAFTRDLPLLAFAATGDVVFTAAYALARSITMAPVVLFSSSVSRAFYKEAVDNIGDAQLERTVSTLTRLGLFGALLPFAWLSAWGNEALPILLGQRWELAGSMCMLLAPAVWMSLQTGWPERLFEVTRRQGVSFAIQMAFDTIHIVLVLTTIAVYDDPLVTVGAFAISLFAYQVTYLVGVYRVAGFAVRPLARSLFVAVACYAGAVLLLATLRDVSSGGVAMWLSLAGVVGLTTGTVVTRLRRRGSSASDTGAST